VQTFLRHSVYLLHAQSISDPQSQGMESKFMNPHPPSARLQEEECDTGLFVYYFIILACIFCAPFVFSHSTWWDLSNFSKMALCKITVHTSTHLLLNFIILV
jgi:hypothetical protein